MPPAEPSPRPAGFGAALVVDDHPLFCDALSMTLRQAGGIGRVDAAGSLSAALDRLAAGPPVDVVLLDLNLPDVSGLDGLIRLRAAARGLPVIVVSSMGDHRMVAAAIAAGARGFVPKHAGRDTIRAALARVGEGEVFVPDGMDLGEAVAPTARDEAMRRLASLTRQQTRILDLVCAGRMNKQIAWDLSISEATVKAHVTAIMRKLGVQSRTQAVLLAREASFGSVLHA